MAQTDIDGAFEASGYDLGLHAAHLIRRAHQRATARFQEIMGHDDLTPTQFAALATILQEGEISQNLLGRLTAMDPSTISLVVRKLLERGLIERNPCRTDQRLTMIRLTGHGQRYTLSRLETSMDVSSRMLASLSAAEQRTFMRLLRRVAGDDA